jgi:hypothetical protein
MGFGSGVQCLDPVCVWDTVFRMSKSLASSFAHCSVCRRYLWPSLYWGAADMLGSIEKLCLCWKIIADRMHAERGLNSPD